MVKQREPAASRVAIVTGAGTGLGRAYALRLAADGLRVVVNNRRREVDDQGRGSADVVVAEIAAAGGEAVANYEDVCAEGAGERMVTQALETWGRLDVLVNNAGVSQHTPFHKIDLAAFRAIFDVNFLGTLQVTHAAWARMRAAGHGRVLVSTSSAGLHGLHGLSAYAAAKGALIALARTLAAEGASKDVFCNAIAPYAATRMTSERMAGADLAGMAPDLVAPLVASLASERSRVNGQVIVVGHGWARRATSVELAGLVEVGPGAPVDASAQLAGPLLNVAGVCREYRDALDAFEQFSSCVRDTCDHPPARGSLRQSS
jgi:NAD(P)-dependent dehydrogenase (short-subunit alcohol dehydrogenase family)